jgi:hypothetical protein
MHRPVKPAIYSVEPIVILHKTLYHDKRASTMMGDRMSRLPVCANPPGRMIRAAPKGIHCASRKALVFTMNRPDVADDGPPRE